MEADYTAMNGPQLRGALYGCGMISEFHLRGWNRIPDVEIVALCNRTLPRAEQRAREFAPGARVYSDFEELLRKETDLDFVDILTTPELHRRHCLLARDAGLHVICQKPLCNTLSDARQLVGEMAQSDCLFAVHENHRYRPWFRDVLRRKHAGEFGRVPFVHIRHLNATSPGEAYKTESCDGVLLEYGSHLVDMARALLGDPLRVYARTERLNESVVGETLAHVVFEYADATAVVEAGWKNAAVTQGSVLVAGQDGEAWYEGTLTRGDGARLRIGAGPDVVLDESVSPTDAYVESFYLLEREFTDAMLGTGSIVQTGPEHLRTLECTFAAYESARTGSVVNVKV